MQPGRQGGPGEVDGAVLRRPSRPPAEQSRHIDAYRQQPAAPRPAGAADSRAEQGQHQCQQHQRTDQEERGALARPAPARQRTTDNRERWCLDFEHRQNAGFRRPRPGSRAPTAAQPEAGRHRLLLAPHRDQLIAMGTERGATFGGLGEQGRPASASLPPRRRDPPLHPARPRSADRLAGPGREPGRGPPASSCLSPAAIHSSMSCHGSRTRSPCSSRRCSCQRCGTISRRRICTSQRGQRMRMRSSSGGRELLQDGERADQRGQLT